VNHDGSTISILEGAPDPARRPGCGAGGRPERPWIGVRFLCAGAYVRVARSPDGSAYHAVCPRCAKRVKFRVGPGGTDNRFFEVSC
jgi:hypothetical protein